MTTSTSSRLIRSTIDGESPAAGSSLYLRTTRAWIPLRLRISAVPAVASTSKPSCWRRSTGSTIERLSRSATETNTVPDSGRPPNAASWLFANARGKSRSMPMTSPVERISGPSTESTMRPSFVRKRLKGSTASFTATGESIGTSEPSRSGRSPDDFSSAIDVPTMTSDAAFASGMPSAFETKGTVRLARGFASRT